MSAQDLCVELWLEILSYTPKSALHKLVGLNPLLSELALDRLYDEVAFVGHVRETKTMFDQVMSVRFSPLPFARWLNYTVFQDARHCASRTLCND